MKTDELVALLAADRTVEPPPGRRLAVGLVPGLALAACLFVLWAGWRDNLAASFASPRFVFKLTINAALILAAGGMLLRGARPDANPGRWGSMLILLAALLSCAVIAELLVVPREMWWEAARGSNATWCLRLIPALASGPLLASIWMLRHAAPGRPAQSGFAAGLMSAGIGGLLYATHCPDDSPLFVALWYGIATTIVAATGALAGSRLLRW